MPRPLPSLLAVLALCGGAVVAESDPGPAELGPVQRASLRASLPTCPTSRRPQAKFARCFIDRSRAGAANVYRGTGAKEYFDGRSGDDVMVGGGGNDRMIGGPGYDQINGGYGNDTIEVRDGGKDRVVCGPGRDVVIRDAGDEVSRDCEIRR